jgi:hypothetical protein
MANFEIIGAGQDTAHRVPKKKTLYLTLHKKWFDLILNGIKKEEYREQKKYWITRLKEKQYDEIVFTNGYSKTSRKMRVAILDITTGRYEDKPCFVIKLGPVEQITNDSSNANCHPKKEPTIFNSSTNG